MAAEIKKEIQLEIAHVLFIDIVGYSKLSINDQHSAVEELNQVVRASERFQRAEAASRFFKIPTGDGMVLVFYTSPEAPAQCAMEISRALKEHPRLHLRMGIHSGPVSGVVDVTERANLTGAGINVAQRVMDCGDAGHILLSKHAAEDLEEYERWRSFLHDIGTFEGKHGMRVSVTNLYSEEIGNPRLPSKLQAVRKHRAHVRWAQIATAFLVLGAIIAGVFFLARRPTTSALRVLDKSIAVLPFENRSEDKANAYFTDGVQDEILTDLAKIADLKVISRTSVLQYKSGVARNLREIAQQLGVANVVEGSVQRSGNRVRVNAQLIDARNDAHLWAQTYDRDLADVFAIQSEIAKAIADQLQAKLSPNEKKAIEQPPTTDLAAFDLYSRAKTLILMATGQPTIGKNLPQAIELMNQAVARDPAFLLAHCQLAEAHDRLYALSFDRTPARLAQAQAALDAATRLQPEAGETHLARAWHLYCGFLDYPGALAELEKARESLPNEARISELRGYILRRQGKHEEGLRSLESALELDPRNFPTLTQIGHSYLHLRRYREAAAAYDRAVSIYPDHFDAQWQRAELDRYWKADTRSQRRLLDDLRQKDPAAFNERALDVFLLSIAERDVPAAEAALKSLGDEPVRDNALSYNAHANAGLVARLAGNDEKARAAYTAALEEQEKTVRAQPESGLTLALLAFYQAQLGRKEEALRNGRRSLELLPVEKDSLNGALLVGVFAATAARVGEKDLALKHLARAVQLANGPNYGQLKLLVDWDPLRGDPRFEKIVASLAPKEP